jgi:hypothetical protein
MTKFEAKIVEVFKNEFTDDFVVFHLFFEEFDPEKGGQSWNFQRALGADGTVESLGEDDDGVCTVKEIQQVVVYEGIQSIELNRSNLICKFEPEVWNKAGTKGIDISFSISDELWEQLIEFGEMVFQGRGYFKHA